MENAITTYQGETKSICISVPTGFTTGYTMSFTVSDREYYFTGATISVSGLTISDNSATVNITKEQNDITPMVYFFEASITNGTYLYVLAKGSYCVLPSLS